jgi:hypothetical protein
VLIILRVNILLLRVPCCGCVLIIPRAISLLLRVPCCSHSCILVALLLSAFKAYNAIGNSPELRTPKRGLERPACLIAGPAGTMCGGVLRLEYIRNSVLLGAA